MEIDAEERRIIRLFLFSGPGMDDYAAAVERICAEHNEAQHQSPIIATTGAPLLVPVDWHWILESLDPSNPQLLPSRLPVAAGDIFLGLLGERLDSPTTPAMGSNRRFLEIAWNHWQPRAPERHLLYRLDYPGMVLEQRQRHLLDDLFSQGSDLGISSRLFNPLSDRRGVRHRVNSVDNFQERLRGDLERLLPTYAPGVAPTGDLDRQPLAALQVEIFGPHHREAPALQDLGQRAARRFQGQFQSPAANLCQISVSGKDLGKRLVQAGLFILAELIRPRQLNGKDSIMPGVRLVADAMDTPSGTMLPPSNLQFRLNGLQHQPIMPGEFAISRNLLKLLPESLRGRFHRLDEAAKTLLVWRFVAITSPPPQFRRLLGDLLRTLDPHDGNIVQPLLRDARPNFDACYALLEELVAVLRKTPGHSRGAYHARWLLELEQRLRDRGAQQLTAHERLPPPLSSLRQLAGLPPDSQEVALTRDSVEALQMLCRADDLGVASSLETLLEQHRPALLGLLRGDEMPALRRRVAIRLEGIADRVLLNDMAGQRPQDDTVALFQALANTLPDSDLAAISRLLHGEPPAAPADPQGRSPVRQRCELLLNTQIQGGEPNLPEPEVLWPLVASPNAPLALLGSVGDQLAQNGAKHSRKLFFDCARARIQDLNRSLDSPEEFQRLRKLLQTFMRQECFLETGYFQRLETLLDDFLQRATEWSVPTEPYQRVLSLLERAREQRGKPRTRLPQTQGLALPVQQRLAGEWPYLELFVTHPDFRVAGATREHISAHNIERVLFPEINKTLLAQMLREPQLFRRPAAILAALRHPNCDTEFARRQLPQLLLNPGFRDAIRQLANNSSSNPGVRMVAQEALAQQVTRLNLQR